VTEQDLAAGSAPRQPSELGPSRGYLLALGAAAALGGTTPFARLAYDAGTSPLTLLAVRFLAAVLLFAVLLGVLRRSFPAMRKDLPSLLLAGMALTGLTLGYLLSIAYIPVSLAALLLYTYPLMVAAVAPFIEGRRLSSSESLAFIAAFTGLAAALGPDLAELDMRGVALALFAAVSNAILLFSVRRLTSRGHHPLSILLVGNLIGLMVVTGLLLMVETPVISSGGFGLTMLSIAACLYLVGVAASVIAIRDIGPTTTALFLNLEPVVAILLAMLLLDEQLSLLQAGGVLLVVLAIYLPSRRARSL
jgi:drug/metabolite transporter (DMT)-like permease